MTVKSNLNIGKGWSHLTEDQRAIKFDESFMRERTLCRIARSAVGIGNLVDRAGLEADSCAVGE